MAKNRISAVRIVKSGGKNKIVMYSNPKPKAKAKGKGKAYKKQLNDFELEVARLVNKERTDRGLKPLVINTQLSDIARLKSRDMRDNNYVGHISPTYGGPIQLIERFGVQWRSTGENIAVGQLTPAAVMAWWMNSPGHRGNILNPNFTDIGVGFVAGTPSSQWPTYWTQIFIERP